MAQTTEQSRNWTGIVAGVLVLIVAAFLIGNKPSAPSPSSSDQTIPESTVLERLTYSGQDGKSAYELLAATHQVEVQNSDIGVLVEKIDGVGGDPNTYWLYYVDGAAATVGADQFSTKTGQTIEWRYERF